MIAALQMYDWPEVAAGTDAFWADVAAALRGQGVGAPGSLSRPAEPGLAWRDPSLLLGQSCGLPYVSGACGDAVLVARPVFAVPGCGAGTYRSALVCRAGEEGPLERFRGGTAAVSEYGSQSGCNALADAVRPFGEGFFGRVLLTGSHRGSVRAVAGGRADLAAIDAVAWALSADLEREAHARLAVVGWTEEMPALPYITAAAHRPLVPALRSALAAAARPGGPAGVPDAVLPAVPADFEPVRAMARRLRGLRIAPGAEPLPGLPVRGT